MDSDLTAGPAQTWGAVRLVPLLRAAPVPGLRLAGKDPQARVRYVPHAFVPDPDVDLCCEGRTAACYGTQLFDPAVFGPAAKTRPRGVELRFRRRAGRHRDTARPRFLPAQLASEGYLTLQFDGPAAAWRDWTRDIVGRGMSMRVDAAYHGADVPGLDDALRVFEIHPRQCGVVVYLADVVATVFVVPHPEDYRALHPTLVHDLYGDVLHQYAHLYPPVRDLTTRLDTAQVSTVDDLRAQLATAVAGWEAFHPVMAGALADLLPGGGAGTMQRREITRVAGFTLSRLQPPLHPEQDNHVGETITTADGRLAYCSTLRLSTAQTRRGHLLSRLAANAWHLDRTAAELGTDRAGLLQRLDRAGFTHLLR